MEVKKIDTLKQYLSQTMSYERDSCQGFLRKQGQSKGIWSKLQDKIQTRYQRYFVLDHKTQTLQIFLKNDPESESRIYMYVDIEQCQEVNPITEKKAVFVQQAVQLRWSFAFSIKLKQCTYNLYAPSEDERTLWVFVFKWIIEENKRIQKLKSEDQELAKKFTQLTLNQKAAIIEKTMKLKGQIKGGFDKTEIKHEIDQALK